MFKTKKINDKNVFYSDMLDIEHFFTSRDIILADNIDLIAKYLNISPYDIFKPHQVHSINIEVVKDDKKDYPDCDGLILSEKNKAIYLNFADCTPVILYDNKNNIASIVHAGWRGTAGGIVRRGVKKMGEFFLTNPEDVIAIIGPAISFEHFETSIETIEELKKSVLNTDGLFRGKYADLKGINKRQLEEIGVKKIDVCPYCTVNDNDKFFSYRKENKTRNRHSALIKL